MQPECAAPTSYDAEATSDFAAAHLPWQSRQGCRPRCGAAAVSAGFLTFPGALWAAAIGARSCSWPAAKVWVRSDLASALTFRRHRLGPGGPAPRRWWPTRLWQSLSAAASRAPDVGHSRGARGGPASTQALLGTPWRQRRRALLLVGLPPCVTSGGWASACARRGAQPQLWKWVAVWKVSF